MLSAFLALSLSQAPLKVEDLAFMAGSWRAKVGGGVYEETWMAPSAQTMLGVAKLSSEGATKQVEFLQIEPREGGLVMWVQIGPHSKPNRRVVAFKCSAVREKKAVFENNGNEHPSRITYEIVQGTLKATLEGRREGQALKEEYVFEKV